MTKIAVVTGAGRGIGLEWAHQLNQNGWTVWACSRTLTPELKSLMESGCHVQSLDVTNVSEIRALVDKMKDSGVSSVDLLVNNAGVLERDPAFSQLSMESVAQSFEVNTLGPMRFTQALLPLLKQSKNPVVLNTTSQMGSIADNGSGGYYSYRISKAALNMFNKSFAIDHPSVISMVVHPGWVQTQMGGAGAQTSPEESVRGMIQLVLKAAPKDSGRFFNFRGQELPW